MSKLKPYEKYQPVQYDYVAEIPEGWKLLPNIAVFEERIERGFVDEELLSVTIGRGVIRQTDVDIKKDSSNEDKSKYKLVKIGDIAYNRMRMWQGALGYSDYRGITSPAYVILKPKLKINQRFFHYMFRAGFYTNYSKRFSYGIVDDQLSLRYVDFKRMYSILPPLETQNAIVEFLDRKTKKTQEFIQRKKRLIALLEEKINKTILDTLLSNNNVVLPLKARCMVIDCKHTTPTYINGGVPVVSPGELKPYRIDLNGSRSVNDLDFEVLSQGGRKPNFGDVLYSRNASVGSAALVPNDTQFCMGQDVCLIRSKKFHPEYLEHLLNSQFVVNQVEQTLIGSTIRRINISEIKVLKIICPPLTVQKSNCIEIDKKTDPIKLAISKAQSEIEKAKEYQESLITQTVTGQLKVPALTQEVILN